MWLDHLEKVMLKQGIKIIVVLFLGSCGLKNDPNKIKDESVKVVGITAYNNVVSLINDSVNLWKLNKLQNYIEVKTETRYVVDSLLCFNKKGDRLITCLLGTTLLKPPTGGITFLYGEKINNQWYFFSGANIFIPYEMKESKDNNPFDFSQLHNIALKEIYGGYLKSNGEINDAWFTSLFEGAGWANWDDSPEKIKNYTRKDYEQLHLKKVRGNWSRANKDSIKQLPINKNNLP